MPRQSVSISSYWTSIIRSRGIASRAARIRAIIEARTKAEAEAKAKAEAEAKAKAAADAAAKEAAPAQTKHTTPAGGGVLGEPSGDYSLDTLPDGVLTGNSGSQTRGAMTPAERAAVLDERLRRGYETFDGFILSERERAQNESNAAGSAQPGGGPTGGGGGQNQPQTLEEASGQPSGAVVTSQSASTRPEENQTFAPPEDIPSGRDDDVVARQRREAAMSEPDPDLREALWDEYRNYTGIGEEQ